MSNVTAATSSILTVKTENTAWKSEFIFTGRQDNLSGEVVKSSLLGLSLPAALSSGSESLCSSAGAFYSPGSAAAPGGSGTPSDPRAECK